MKQTGFQTARSDGAQVLPVKRYSIMLPKASTRVSKSWSDSPKFESHSVVIHENQFLQIVEFHVIFDQPTHEMPRMTIDELFELLMHNRKLSPLDDNNPLRSAFSKVCVNFDAEYYRSEDSFFTLFVREKRYLFNMILPLSVSNDALNGLCHDLESSISIRRN